MIRRNYTGTTTQNPSIGWIDLADVPANYDIIPLQLVAEDGAPSRGLLYMPRGKVPRVGVHVMHPRTDLSTNYNILPLVKAGYAVFGRAGRWPNNDSATIHEYLLLDMAAGIRCLRAAGCSEVILLGNSGGSSLAAFYQAQAQRAPEVRLTHTPAGDAIDLANFDLPVADGVVVIGGHIGQGGVMGKLIDPAVVDECDPLLSDPALDMYDRANGFATPPMSSQYGVEFLARYRAAQGARAKRIDAKALSILQQQREARELVARLGDSASMLQVRAAKVERHMIIYRTTAYPAFTDLSIEPDGRQVFSYYSGNPEHENYEGNGFARYITPRGWLSTWSPERSNARTIDNLAQQNMPLLVVHYAGDCGTRTSEARAMFEASASDDKSFELVESVDHFGFSIVPPGEPAPRNSRGTDIVVDWLRTRFPI